MHDEAYKPCTRCGETRPLTEFYWDKRHDRAYSHCKPCHLAAVKRWKDKNRDANNAYRAAWAREGRKMDPEKWRDANRRFAEKMGPTYSSWQAMLNRCRNENIPTWPHYGGRGITICERWESYESFLADMGERPDGRSLDRINVDGNYEPGNCRWATAQEQARNQRRHAGKVWEDVA